MKNPIALMLAMMLFVPQSFAATYDCNVLHTDVSISGTNKIDYDFTLRTGESKLVNFPSASRKLLHVSLEKIGLRTAISAGLSRNYNTLRAGEITETEAQLTNVDALLSIGAVLEGEPRTIELSRQGASHELNAGLYLSCTRR